VSEQELVLVVVCMLSSRSCKKRFTYLPKTKYTLWVTRVKTDRGVINDRHERDRVRVPTP
jgi:hypothetical protein